ncbi:MAG TPA: hypothetical protein VJG49_03345 [Candidatus Nanoarchaeia archaeon]|nr:hypothetical protein [Candidatus Nanoarchaeia archaeon]
MIMSDTLKARLEELCLLKERAKSLEVNVAESEWSDAKVRILKEFYSQNQLAYVVAGEKDSYKARIGFIEEKYDSFWKRIWIPKKDEAFDNEVLKIIGSINKVGEYRDIYGKSYINPKSFTTDGRKKSIRGPDSIALAGGGVFSLLGAGIVYSGPHCYDPETVACYEKVTGGTLVASFVVLMLPALYGMSKFSHTVGMSSNLDCLRTAAQKTDEFLRQNYI